ncbi:MAG: hypothetical protein CM15mP14_3200 [Rhodospirillaceae bacterium]|nr:MAG: hypothetical protein CM15mP14_3200 [Rhodospirillaceae bacterium]
MSFKNRLKQIFLGRTLAKYNYLYRPSSLPFISGDTLRNYADHVYDETKKLNPNDVRNNEIIFLKTDFLDSFFNSCHTKINSKYILITHNSDISIEDKTLSFLDEKIIHWFGMSLNVKMNEVITPLPIGLENKRYLQNGIVSNFKKVLSSKEYDPNSKKNKIFCSFNEHTNFDVRGPLMEIGKKRDDVIVKKFYTHYEYLNELSKYKYNLCPEGNNYESHRVWESLLFNCTPVVVDNKVNRNFFNLGIPMIILKSWEEFKNLTINDLDELNKPNKNKNYKEFVYFKYWERLILSKKLK